MPDIDLTIVIAILLGLILWKLSNIDAHLKRMLPELKRQPENMNRHEVVSAFNRRTKPDREDLVQSGQATHRHIGPDAHQN